MSSDPIRAALERLIQAIDGIELEGVPEVDDAMTAARAALAAASEGEGPSDWLTVALVAQDMRSRGLAEQLAGNELLKMANSHQTRPAAPPAPLEGEVGELVAWLLAYRNEEFGPLSDHPFACSLTRTAALLSQLSAAAPAVVPIPVSERLPGAEDCDAEGRCWLLTVEDEYPQWRLHSVEGHQPGGRMIWVPVDRTPGVMVDAFYVSLWLPAHALPLPAPQGGEVDG